MINGQVTTICRILRKSKIDKLPQLINMLKSDMSFVGPRPYIPGYYDVLKSEQRKILVLQTRSNQSSSY
jgi:lipopolysaccharide/colanic/teichoic acid biosynthesis glycosyltransferase